MHSVLIIDDEPDILELLDITLSRMELEVQSASDMKSALSLLDKRKFDLCLTDMRLPDGDGLEIITYAQKKHSQLPIAVITAHGSMETAIQALKLGAFDFLSKPVDINLLRTLVTNALQLSDERTPHSSQKMIGESSGIGILREKIQRLSRSLAPVYISGESGTGKELAARMIHEQGPRSEKPFIPVNCGAIPHDLMESEFFGHKKGSFTGAILDKQGFFQAADGGTLFLDEVAELPSHMQVKLLRVIQEKQVRSIGEQKESPVNVRVLSATHKDLYVLVKEGKFREDLFYRINVIELNVPPLRDRGEDIPILAENILSKIADENSLKQTTLSAEALQALQNYSYPGNIRELENILERASTLCEGLKIGESDLGITLEESKLEGNKSDDVSLDSYLGDIEKSKIIHALEQTRWNKTKAAKLLGISFRALRYRLEKLGLD
ncbi:MAG: sigma-54-dependent Fis family transcriptional regulator [Gammaproteobacteria bacterium]|jgi:two-component system, NtrC family, response regulator PilR|nr:sigma-54-dependent Fis family transcriptional regulator [Gammaproteobacteria bacterium]